MYKKKVLFAIVPVIILMTGITSCGKQKTTGSFTVRLTDGPGDYEEVNVDIQSIEVHVVPKKDKSEWMELSTRSGIYDLLTLQNGVDTLLADKAELPEGKITQMRLILGDSNSVKVDSVTYDMTVPSGSQTGIKLIGEMEIIAGEEYTITIDFDAAESVIEEGTGDYKLKPVIKVIDTE